MTAPPVRVLVVDDEPPIRRLLRTSLSANGYEVEEAGTGRDAEAADRALPAGRRSCSISGCRT